MGKLRILEPFNPKKPVEIGIDANSIDDLDDVIAKLGGEVSVEIKKDGFNAAIHKKGNDLKVYTSGKGEYDLDSMPELMDDLRLLDDGIYVGEIHGKSTGENFTNKDAFEAIQKRSRAKGREAINASSEAPLTLSLYDVYIYDSFELLETEQRKRRALLEKIVEQKGFENTQLVEAFTVRSGQELKELYDTHIATGEEEGFVLKDPRSKIKVRENGVDIEIARTDEWVKLKRFSTFDLSLLGFYETENSRKKGLPYSAALLGSYNDETDEYETVVKVQINPGMDGYYEIFDSVNENIEDFDNATYGGRIRFSKAMRGEKIPAKVIKDPSSAPVIQVRAMGVSRGKGSWHSCGLDEDGAYSLRIPIYEHVRHDKTAKEANTTKFIKKYYEGLG